MRWLACLLSCVLGSWAAPVVVFDEVGPAEGWAGARLRVGGGAAGGYRQLDPEAAAGCAVLTADGSVPLTDERPFGGQGRALRLSIGSGAGWWSLELPIPPVELPRSAWADGRLTIAVRGRLGGESVELGLIDNAAPRHAVRLPLGRYGRVETGWTLYRVPLQDYLALAPDLAVDRLGAVQLFSARAEPITVDVDHVLIEPGPLPPAPVRVVYEAAPAASPSRPSPRSGPGAGPAGVEPEVARPATSPAAAQPAAPALPPPVQAPSQPTTTRVDPPLPPPAPAAGPAAPTPPVATRPAVTPPAAPASPGKPPQPAASAPAEPVSPASPIVPNAPPAGPRPDSPAAPNGPVRLPDEVRPMLPVSFFFTEAAGGQEFWPTSLLRASWATNQGERAFEPAELGEYFGVADGDRLPVVMVSDPGRSGAVLKIQVKQPGFAWWTAQVGRLAWETSDERPYLRNGRLELAIRGEVGEEAVRVGLVDAQEAPEVAQVLLSRHAVVTKDWQIVRVPLRELKAANPRLDWSRVRAVQIASAHGRPLTIYIDDIRIVNPVAGEE